QQEGLTALVTNPGVEKWDGAYLKKAVPNDPWGNPYQYRNPGEHGGEVDIYSYGQDNQPGGEKENADIGSWE
ncbi:MAG: type II secretion system protein GspG, partial [Desulfurivibrionaceae bacterium]